MAVKPVDVWKLREHARGPVVTCQGRQCQSRYVPFPKQSHKLCKVCKPPTQQCAHGVVVDYFYCPQCKAITGRDDRYVGLRRIKAKV